MCTVLRPYSTMYAPFCTSYFSNHWTTSKVCACTCKLYHLILEDNRSLTPTPILGAFAQRGQSLEEQYMRKKEAEDLAAMKKEMEKLRADVDELKKN